MNRRQRRAGAGRGRSWGPSLSQMRKEISETERAPPGERKRANEGSAQCVPHIAPLIPNRKSAAIRH
jgi:hypothetical protein